MHGADSDDDDDDDASNSRDDWRHRLAVPTLQDCCEGLSRDELSNRQAPPGPPRDVDEAAASSSCINIDEMEDAIDYDELERKEHEEPEVPEAPEAPEEPEAPVATTGGGASAEADGNSASAAKQKRLLRMGGLLGSVRNEKLRRGLDWQARIAEAEQLKAEANAQFQEGANERALGGYIAAIWMLKPENPPSPKALSSAIWALRPSHPLRPARVVEGGEPLRGFEGVRNLGEGMPLAGPDEIEQVDLSDGLWGQSLTDGGGEMSEESKKAIVEWIRWTCYRRKLRDMQVEEAKVLGSRCLVLRASLHLNVAASALRLKDFELADAACQFVLRREPGNPKALYRLAVSQRGMGHLKTALKTLVTLLSDPSQAGNADARQMAHSVREEVRGDASGWGGVVWSCGVGGIMGVFMGGMRRLDAGSGGLRRGGAHAAAGVRR